MMKHKIEKSESTFVNSVNEQGMHFTQLDILGIKSCYIICRKPPYSGRSLWQISLCNEHFIDRRGNFGHNFDKETYVVDTSL